MSSQNNSLPFAGTKEQEEQLHKVMADHNYDKGFMMAILQKAQDIYGYLPIEVQTIISNEINVPLEKIYGIVTFYSQFSLNPKGKYKISVCLGTACYVKGAGNLVTKLETMLGIKNGECTPDGKFSLEPCRCIGACGLAPVLTVNDDVYGKLAVDDLNDIVNKYNSL